MTILRERAKSQPERSAYIFPQAGEPFGYGELDHASDLAACWMVESGLTDGDTIALLEMVRSCWRWPGWPSEQAFITRRSVAILSPSEIAYILRNSVSWYLIFSASLTPLAASTIECPDAPSVVHDGIDAFEVDGVINYDDAVAGCDASPVSGTYHAFKFAKYAPRYVADFQYRFNRRYKLRSIPPRLLNAAAINQPWPEPQLTLAELGAH